MAWGDEGEDYRPDKCDHAADDGCMWCCQRCNYDRHTCPGCGTIIGHKDNCCGDCDIKDDDTMRTLYNLGDMADFVEFGIDRDIPPWAFPMPGMVLHLGPGVKVIERAVELDKPEWDADKDPMPISDNVVGAIFATHFFEHLADPRRCLRECARVMRNGAPLNIMVPHGQSLAYLQDLDHKTPFVIDTWKNLLQNPYYDNGGELPFDIGANFTFAVAERNTMLVTQLIRR